MPGRSALQLMVVLASLIIFTGRESPAQSLGGTPPETAASTDTLIDVGGHSLHIRMMGEGSPAVVIDVGFGASIEEWEALAGQLAQDTRVCLYDRAAYGQSEPGPLPRTADRVADELLALLSGAGVEPPYVMVGHSLGGLHSLVFAHRHPDLLSGLVLLDPPPIDFITGRRFLGLKEMADEQTQQLEQSAEQAEEHGDSTRATYFRTLASEHRAMFSESAELAAAVTDLDDLPLTVLASGVPNPAFGDSAQAFQRFWIKSNQQLAKISRSGRFQLAPNSSHRLHEDASALVLRIIRERIKAARE